MNKWKKLQFVDIVVFLNQLIDHERDYEMFERYFSIRTLVDQKYIIH